MNPARARRGLIGLPVAAWLVLAAPAASGFELMARTGIQTIPAVLPTPLTAVTSAWTAPSLLRSPRLTTPTLAPQTMVVAVPIPAALPFAAGPVVSPEAAGRWAAPGTLKDFAPVLSGFARSRPGGTAKDFSELQTLFDGARRTGADAEASDSVQASAFRESRPDYKPHDSVPLAVLPSGQAIPPDSFTGGYHGTDIGPDEVQSKGGLPARGPVEDWRLLEHAEAASTPVSAFRGSTPFPTSPDGQTGASYWADKGGWVYDVSGVPTWNVNPDLEGRIKRGDGTFRGNLMSEDESAFPAQTPLECIQRWGRVSESAIGNLYVRSGDWIKNPRYDPAICRKFWGRAPTSQ